MPVLPEHEAVTRAHGRKRGRGWLALALVLLACVAGLIVTAIVRRSVFETNGGILFLAAEYGGSPAARNGLNRIAIRHPVGDLKAGGHHYSGPGPAYITYFQVQKARIGVVWARVRRSR